MEAIKTLLKIKSELKTSDQILDTKINQFEKILMDTPDITEVEICDILYGNTDKKGEFRTLKHRFEQKLHEDVMLASGGLKNYDNFSLRYLVAEKNNLIISTLYRNGYQNEAAILAKKNLAFCKENYLTESAIILTVMLMNYHGFIKPNEKQMANMLAENKKLSEIYHAENIIHRYNAIISNWVVSQKGSFENAKIEKVRVMLVEIEALKNEHLSWLIYFLYYSIAHFYYTLIGDYHLSLHIAREGLEKSNSLFLLDKMMKYRCNIRMGQSHFYLKDYTQASIQYQNALAIAPEGHRLWFEDGLQYFTILLRAKDYASLYALYLSRIHHKNLKRFVALEEQWKVREAFIEFLFEVDYLDRQELNHKKSRDFSIQKFINNVPFYTKDKDGLHIFVIILKILFLISKNKYEQIDSQTDTLNQYVYKYLNKRESKRSFYFIKMLIKMSEIGFHPIRLVSHTKSLYQKLENQTFAVENQSNTVEILPYEDLWQIILDTLRKNQAQASKYKKPKPLPSS